MAKDMKKESKGKAKKAPSKASPFGSSFSVGQTVSNAPASKAGSNVKPNPGVKR